MKTKLEKESLDLSGQVEVRKIVLSKLALPPAIKKKVAFFEHPISLSFLYNFYPKTTDFLSQWESALLSSKNKKPVVFSLRAEQKERKASFYFLVYT
ncbi:MAG: hypothetical protein H6925_03275 [Holosporaceae bacterium]|nr:MAG: hypothetical protein H6925_03275 [Holosporaceae bacterium]